MEPSRPTPSFLLTVGLLLAACGTAAGSPQEAPLRYLQGLGDVGYHLLRSEGLERPFHIYVQLPRTSAEGDRAADRVYPTVYLLDGGITFPLLAAYTRYLNLADEVPDVIVVGISYGTVDYEKGNLRGTDFTAPAADREYYGGAAAYQRMLREELQPLIEENYPSDPARRIVFGQSLGGQFVLFTALTDPGLFWGHIASNPALHRNLDFFLEAPEVAPGVRRPRVFVASAEHDEERFRVPALRWMEHWAGRDRDRWQLRTTSLPGHGHFSAAPASFRDGMRWLLQVEETQASAASR